ncbi:MAG TPA: four helix bundle protein, partial [Ignavibacteria bacterium]
ISEGSIGQSNPEFKKFIGFSIRSLAEVVTCLYKASKRNYISEEEFKEHYEYAYNLMNMILPTPARKYFHLKICNVR